MRICLGSADVCWCSGWPCQHVRQAGGDGHHIARDAAVANKAANAVGTFESSHRCFLLLDVFSLAAIQILKVVLGVGTIFVTGSLVFPFVHLAFVKHVARLHFFYIVLDLRQVGRWHSDVPSKMFLFVQLTGIFRDVGFFVPLHAKILCCLSFLEGGD